MEVVSNCQQDLDFAANIAREALQQFVATTSEAQGTNSENDIALTLQEVRDAMQKLGDHQQLATISKPLEGISQSAKGLADSVAQIIVSRNSPESICENAKKALANLVYLFASSKYAAASASGQIKPGIEPQVKQAQEACETLASSLVAPAQDEMVSKQIISVARQAARAVSSLVSALREASAAASPAVAQEIINAAQSFATCTGKLVSCKLLKSRSERV